MAMHALLPKEGKREKWTKSIQLLLLLLYTYLLLVHIFGAGLKSIGKNEGEETIHWREDRATAPFYIRGGVGISRLLRG